MQARVFVVLGKTRPRWRWKQGWYEDEAAGRRQGQGGVRPGMETETAAGLCVCRMCVVKVRVRRLGSCSRAGSRRSEAAHGRAVCETQVPRARTTTQRRQDLGNGKARLWLGTGTRSRASSWHPRVTAWPCRVRRTPATRVRGGVPAVVTQSLVGQGQGVARSGTWQMAPAQKEGRDAWATTEAHRWQEQPDSRDRWTSGCGRGLPDRLGDAVLGAVAR